MIRIFESKQSTEIKEILKQSHDIDKELLKNVDNIVTDIRDNGEEAVFKYTELFDGISLNSDNWIVSEVEYEEAYELVEKEFIESLKNAKKNIYDFHQKQMQKSWWTMDDKGNITGQIYRPIERVGVYVPGGTAPLFSSVLMTAIPAVVAGVKEIIMTTPPNKEGKINPYTLVAAKEAGVTAVYKVGGAQAIAALAYGTESLKNVQKIVGPGNIFVTLAKKLVYGQVDIDMLAGPSEILIVADESAKAKFLAADLLSQAEHDKLARSILITTSKEKAIEVQKELEVQLSKLNRKEIAYESIENNGAIIVVEDLEEAANLANEFAPEHLELAVKEPFNIISNIKNAGAIFLGHYTPEPVGDYYAGPNHVLPTGGTAKFYSPLNVDMYLKKSSLISYSKQGIEQAADDVIRLATLEGLDAHANSVRVRVGKEV